MTQGTHGVTSVHHYAPHVSIGLLQVLLEKETCFRTNPGRTCKYDLNLNGSYKDK